MRLFVAVDLEEDLKDRLEHYIERLKKAGFKGNFSRKNNLHITLCFIGETNNYKAAEEALKRVAFNAFSYRLTAVGRFKGSKGDILFINIDSSGRLEALAGSIRKELIKEGFILENKEFKAHLTLGREIRDYDILIAERLLYPHMSAGFTEGDQQTGTNVSDLSTFTEERAAATILNNEHSNNEKTKDSTMPALEGAATELSLMRSDRIKGVLKYTAIFIKK